MGRILTIVGMNVLLLLMTACSPQERSEEASSSSPQAVTQQADSAAKTQALAEMKESAMNGRIKGIELPLDSMYQEVVRMYGEPAGIDNVECWTYSYGHTLPEVFFYYNHDSCGSDLNVLKPGAIVNKITVSPDYFKLKLTTDDVKAALGQPGKEYEDEAYGGYYLIYDAAPYQLVFVTVDDNPESKDIRKISVLKPKE